MNNCTACNKDFEGRSNQKFCSTKCKNAYHNVKNKEKEAHLIETNRMLHKNWTVLGKLYDIYRSSPISIEIAKSFGFTDKYHTHVHKSPRGEQYTMVYDYGFKNHIDNQIQIVQGEL
jgi:hypothetical protein